MAGKKKKAEPVEEVPIEEEEEEDGSEDDANEEGDDFDGEEEGEEGADDDEVGRRTLNPGLKAPRFQSLVLKSIRPVTVLSI